MQPTQLLQLAAAAWQGPALCSFSGIYVSQSAATYDEGGSKWYIALRLAPQQGQPAQDFKGHSPCPFQALREAFRALRTVAPGYAFAAVWAVMQAEDAYAGVPARA
ncbi:hypothetical protein ACFQ48_14250 [Hymenobacter caeli]|uniref:Uncharacterized protein n=1 Tax=Hymenobacter caeli TaxID=2735894 RepID=A0ABX2FSU3_9BACT|nr:hypothetical protein [Hymenobacter caeli]NRT20081.1 hypothetical protein [Hymenobacter caeli]